LHLNWCRLRAKPMSGSAGTAAGEDFTAGAWVVPVALSDQFCMAEENTRSSVFAADVQSTASRT